jgi:prevent-host-death family protein
MISVKSTEIQKTFGKWLDKTHEGPVAITKYDRPAAFLISAREYEDLRANYRKRVSVEELTDREMDLISKARVASNSPFNMNDLPEPTTGPTRKRRRT